MAILNIEYIISFTVSTEWHRVMPKMRLKFTSFQFKMKFNEAQNSTIKYKVIAQITNNMPTITYIGDDRYQRTTTITHKSLYLLVDMCEANYRSYKDTALFRFITL